jgi:glutathione synthase/RimK-type ligase-like ATP-grasp enzyme
MSTHLILVENPKDWRTEYPEVSVVSARDYLMSPADYKVRGTRVVNLCRGYGYLSTGYYCSLLAEARRHRVIPSVHTLTDLSSKAIYSLNVDDLDALLQKALERRAKRSEDNRFETLVCFGRSQDPELRDIGRQLFELFPAPLLKVEFRRRERWQLASLKPVHLGQLKGEQHGFFADALSGYLSKRWHSTRSRSVARYDIAILYNPDEKMPPSDENALRRFIEAGRKLGADVELITKKDYNRLAEYDALFIRETTNIDHHTYSFAKKADAEGMAVIDDPESIVKCTNKVYLTELLTNHKVPVPRSLILRKGEAVDLEGAVGFPAVLKIPDGSFSRGVFKAKDAEEAVEITTKLFKESDLILAQEYLYTDFDWRIGVLDGEPLFACQYFMSPAHWQIVHHKEGEEFDEGGFTTLPIPDVPKPVLNAALSAARLIGKGFYGVDLKSRDDKVVVIEVNDNPNVDEGVEDGVLGGALYERIMQSLVRRVEDRRRG